MVIGHEGVSRLGSGAGLGGCSEDDGAKDPSLAFDSTGSAPPDGTSPGSDSTPLAGTDTSAEDSSTTEATSPTPDAADDTSVEPTPDGEENPDTGSPLGACEDPQTHACAACVSDDDCGGRCLTIDGELRCAPMCTGDTDCAPGFGCVSTGEGNAAELTCQPLTHTCSCW